MLLQEYIKTPYDVRVMVLNEKVVGQLRRDVIDNDFRSNISQGQEPKKIELTELEESECVKAAKSVDGKWVGVDFIPAKDRNKDLPFFIEINATPGTKGYTKATGMNVCKDVIKTFMNRDNWTLDN